MLEGRQKSYEMCEECVSHTPMRHKHYTTVLPLPDQAKALSSVQKLYTYRLTSHRTGNVAEDTGKVDTDAMLYSIEDVNKHCLEEFRRHWTCLDNNNQQLWQCRPAEWKLNKCVFDNLVSPLVFISW